MHRRQEIRPLPVILPPLADELLSSWVSRHAAFVGVSAALFLGHYHIDAPTARDLDVRLSRDDRTRLADVLRCAPHLVHNMTQSRGGKVRSRLVSVRQRSQFCRACARRHAANRPTRGAWLRSWMEGWRITCPVCGAALEDFPLYTRLFRADPRDPFVVKIESRARDGEQIMDRASTCQCGGSAHAALMRSLLLPQTPRARTRETVPTAPRTLDLVVPGSEEFFQRLAPENWLSTSRMLPLSIRIPVLAGVAAVSMRPNHWIDKLLSAATPAHHAVLRECATALAASNRRAETTLADF
jgi:hypothetical protein